jgi:hypothetical protein
MSVGLPVRRETFAVYPARISGCQIIDCTIKIPAYELKIHAVF